MRWRSLSYALGRSLRYVWANEHYAKWLRVTLDQIIGRPIADVLGQQAFGALRAHFERELRGERVEYQEKLISPGSASVGY